MTRIQLEKSMVYFYDPTSRESITFCTTTDTKLFTTRSCNKFLPGDSENVMRYLSVPGDNEATQTKVFAAAK